MACPGFMTTTTLGRKEAGPPKTSRLLWYMKCHPLTKLSVGTRLDASPPHLSQISQGRGKEGIAIPMFQNSGLRLREAK